MQSEKILQQIPSYLKPISDKLANSGFKAYLVGGAIRDILLDRKPKDYDIATDAKPEKIIELFPDSVATGAKFGNIIVISHDESGERYDVDVTTFRIEEDYFGGRWPGKVEFTNSIENDLSRRDFTINSLALDLVQIFSSNLSSTDSLIIDPFGGIKDLNDKIIRAVGDPNERFNEDGLRAFKACRLASELEFTIEPGTLNAMKATTEVAKQISMERIRDEINKALKYAKKPSIAFRLMDEAGLLEIVIPELIEAKEIVQPEWHTEDLFNHSLNTLDLAEDSIKLAALLHDIGKVKTKTIDDDGKIHFFGHDVVGAEMSREILKRLRYSNSEVDRVSNLIRWHMFYYPSADWRKDNDLESESDELANKESRIEAFKHGWTDSAIRRFVKNVGGDDQIDDLIKLRIADAESNKKSSFNPKEIQALEQRIAEVRSKDMIFKVSDLEIKGEDLISLGITPGKEMGNILNRLLEMVIDEPNLNTKEKLLKLVSNNFVQK